MPLFPRERERERERERDSEPPLHFRFRRAVLGRKKGGAAAVTVVVAVAAAAAPAGLPRGPSGKCQLLTTFRWQTLCRRVLLPRTPPSATRSLPNRLASHPKPGQPPIPGTTLQALPLPHRRDCLLARPPPTCLSDHPRRECILPCPPEPPFLSRLLVLLALLGDHTHPLALPHQGNTLHLTCPFQSSPGRMGAPQNQPTPLSARGGRCLLEDGGPQLGGSILPLACHIRPQGRILHPPKHPGLPPQCHGVLSLQDLGDHRHQPPFLHLQGPILLQDSTQHHLIHTKCHPHLLGLHPCLVALIPTVEFVVVNRRRSLSPPAIYNRF